MQKQAKGILRCMDEQAECLRIELTHDSIVTEGETETQMDVEFLMSKANTAARSGSADSHTVYSVEI